MSEIYTVIVGILGILAISGLFVGVTNDAVNFLNSAIGSKAAPMRTILLVASIGIIIGVVTSSGMMEVARSGMFNPGLFTFHEVMMLYLGVMFANIILLDLYNSWGLPTSTTVSLIFCLLGSAIAVSIYKISNTPDLGVGALGQFINTSRAMGIVSAILLSVVIAFTCGTFVMYVSRTIFSFRYTLPFRRFGSMWCGASLTAIVYFAVFKGLKSILAGHDFVTMVDNHLLLSLLICWVVCSLLLFFIQRFKINILRITILSGTFALALAFAGNDLVNFIGVPLAGLDSLNDFLANGHGNYDSFMMDSLMTSAKSPLLYLLIAGIIMIIAMATSKKAQNVVKTSVDLSRQDEGDEMFGSSRVARSMVRATQDIGETVSKIIPVKAIKWIDSRFNKEEVILAQGAAFDEVRAAVNLVLAALLIVVGTNYKLPLSTTYVTFMVAMGSSLADRAWSRESAVFRVTGVISVIGGWFVTAGVAFAVCAIVCALMHFGGFIVMIAFMCLDIYLLWRSNRNYAKKVKEEKKDDVFQLMMRTKDKEIVWDLLSKHVARTQSFVTRFALEQYNRIVEGISNESLRELRHCGNALKEEQSQLKKFRRKELLAMRRIPGDIAIERNTWFHLGANSNQQFIYCLKRMLDPIKEHVDNNFNPLPKVYLNELESVRRKISELMNHTEQMISTNRYDLYQETLAIAEELKEELSAMRKNVIDHMYQDNSTNLKVSLLYLNILQESQEFVSIMRHQLRAARKFLEERQ